MAAPRPRDPSVPRSLSPSPGSPGRSEPATASAPSFRTNKMLSEIFVSFGILFGATAFAAFAFFTHTYIQEKRWGFLAFQSIWTVWVIFATVNLVSCLVDLASKQAR